MVVASFMRCLPCSLCLFPVPCLRRSHCDCHGENEEASADVPTQHGQLNGIGQSDGSTGTRASSDEMQKKDKNRDGPASGMVLPHRIELWTSPLPRECSTTELRQRRKGAGAEPAPPNGAESA